jgi:hypothetical protein
MLYLELIVHQFYFSYKIEIYLNIHHLKIDKKYII